MKSTNRYVKEAMEESLNRVSVLKFQRKLADNPNVKENQVVLMIELFKIFKKKRSFIAEYDTKSVV